MQVNNHNTNNSTAFGMYYSKSTVKSLKKIIPQVIQKEGYESAQQAIKNLQNLGTRNDNLIVDLTSDNGRWYDISPGVKLQKNSPFKYFVYPHVPQGTEFTLQKYKTPFQTFTETLTTEDFIKASHDEINNHAKVLKETPLRKKIRDKFSLFRETMEDALDWVNEKFSVYRFTDRYGRPKMAMGLWLDAKDTFRRSMRKFNKKIPESIVEIRKEIDKLPTR